VTERSHLCRRTALSFAGIRHISYAKAHYSGFRSIAGLNSRSALARGSTKRKITFCPADATISSNRVALLPRAKTRLGHNQPVTVVNCWSAWPLCSGRLIFTVAQTRKCACCRVATSPTSSGLHLWISNLFRRFCSASTGLRLSAVGVKNLRWHLSQVARYGVLPMYLIIENRRSSMMTAFHRFAECCQIPCAQSCSKLGASVTANLLPGHSSDYPWLGTRGNPLETVPRAPSCGRLGKRGLNPLLPSSRTTYLLPHYVNEPSFDGK